MITITSYTRQASLYMATMLLVAMGAYLAGCSKNVTVPEQEGEPVMLSISSRALNVTTDEQINTLRLILIARNPSHTVIVNTFVADPGDPVIIMAKSGNYDVYVIANESVSSGKEYTTLNSIKTRKDLETMTLDFTPKLLVSSNIPMLGEVLNVMITAPEGVPSTSNLAKVIIGGVDSGTKLPVTLTRLLCKLNLTIHYMRDEIKTVTIETLPVKLPLWENHYFTQLTTDTITVAGLIKDNLDPLDLKYDPMYPLTSYKNDILLPSWFFADPANIDNAVKLAVTMIRDPNPTPLPTKPLPLIEETFRHAIGHAIGASDNPKDYTLKRNNEYSLTARVQNNLMTITGIVESWIEENLDIEDDNPVVPAP